MNKEQYDMLKSGVNNWNKYVDENPKAVVDLRGVDLQRANLREADLRGANLDYSCMNFSCKDLGQKLDDRLFYQRLYHLVKQEYNCKNNDIRQFLNLEIVKKLSNKFHMIDECGQF